MGCGWWHLLVIVVVLEMVIVFAEVEDIQWKDMRHTGIYVNDLIAFNAWRCVVN